MTSKLYVNTLEPEKGTDININGVVNSNQTIACSRSLASSSSYSTYAYVPFATVNYEKGFTANASATEFTLAHSGVYFVTWTGLTNLSAANKIALYVDGSFRAEAFAQGGTSGNASYSTLSNSIIISLNANQRIGFNTHNHDGSFYGGTHTTFCIHKIG